MLWFLSFLICHLFISCQCGQQLSCNNKAGAKTTEMRLKLDLLCGYDKYLRPVPHHSNKTTVGLVVAPRIIDFDDYHSTVNIKTWLSMHWKDHHLMWDRLLYDNIDQIILDTTMVWVPDLSVYNTKEATDVSMDQMVYPVIVDFQGDVYGFMSPVLSGHCVPNWANWPHDVHECTITLGSRRYMGSTLDFHFMTDIGLWMKYLLPNRDWELVKTNSSRNETLLGPKNETDSVFLVSLNYNFTLRRHASVQVATYLMPGVVMIIMSLALLWIPSHKSERTAILCTLVIIQCISLQYISYKLPSNGETTPYIVCFYRDCLFLSGLLLIQTIVTRSLLTCTSNPPYLQTIFQFVASNRVLQFILVNDLDPKSAARLMDSGNEEGSTLVASNENVQHSWHMLVNIVNRVSFVMLVPVYILLSVSLMPVNYSFSPN